MTLRNRPGTRVTLPPPPPTLPIWGKALWYIAETVAIGVSWKLYDYGQEIRPVLTEIDAAEAHEWRRYVVHWDDLSSVEAADDQMHSVDIVNYTGGTIDSTWNDTDHQFVGACVANFVAAIGPNTCNRYQAKELRAYRMAFNAYSNIKPFAESGPPMYTQAVGTQGAGGSAAAAQVCTTISERTPVRKHWGRTYLPTLGGSMIDVAGRLTVACVDAYAAAYAALATELHTQDMFLVVPTTQADKQPLRALQAVTEVAVDDVPDVHRSRRLKNVTHRKVTPTPVPLAEEPATKPVAA